jgi:hypothetical protein
MAEPKKEPTLEERKAQNRKDLVDYLQVMADGALGMDDREFYDLCLDLLEILSGELVPRGEGDLISPEDAMKAAEETGELWRAFEQPEPPTHRIFVVSRDDKVQPEVHVVLGEFRGAPRAVYVDEAAARQHPRRHSDRPLPVVKVPLYLEPPESEPKKFKWPPEPGVYAQEIDPLPIVTPAVIRTMLLQRAPREYGINGVHVGPNVEQDGVVDVEISFNPGIVPVEQARESIAQWARGALEVDLPGWSFSIVVNAMTITSVDVDL